MSCEPSKDNLELEWSPASLLQYELMFVDRTTRIAENKATEFQLLRWAVSAIVAVFLAVVALKEPLSGVELLIVSMPVLAAIIPLILGGVAAFLMWSNYRDTNHHRKRLSELMETGRGLMWQLHRKDASKKLSGKWMLASFIGKMTIVAVTSGAFAWFSAIAVVTTGGVL